MVVNDLLTILKAKSLTSDVGLHNEIQYVFCCDCEKIADAKSSRDFVWIKTDITNLSIDLAVKKELSCIILPYDIQIDNDVVLYAVDNSIPILSTGYSSYKICAKIYEAFKERT